MRFSEFLSTIRQGDAESDLTDALHEVTQRVVRSNRAGELVLKIKLQPNKGNSILITDEIQSKPPKREVPDTFLFVDDDFNLCERDPRQLRLPLRDHENVEA